MGGLVLTRVPSPGDKSATRTTVIVALSAQLEFTVDRAITVQRPQFVPAVTVPSDTVGSPPIPLVTTSHVTSKQVFVSVNDATPHAQTLVSVSTISTFTTVKLVLMEVDARTQFLG